MINRQTSNILTSLKVFHSSVFQPIIRYNDIKYRKREQAELNNLREKARSSQTMPFIVNFNLYLLKTNISILIEASSIFPPPLLLLYEH